MKNIFNHTLLLIIFLLVTAAAPLKDDSVGINFFEGTWQEALQKSTAENKLIFLDLSTSWCGWCKKMRQSTYTDNKVGAYFNSRFINVKLDGEHGEGERLAKKLGVTGYPSLFLIDKNEIAVLSSEGYQNAEGLIKLIKTALKEKK